RRRPALLAVPRSAPGVGPGGCRAHAGTAGAVLRAGARPAGDGRAAVARRPHHRRPPLGRPLDPGPARVPPGQPDRRAGAPGGDGGPQRGAASGSSAGGAPGRAAPQPAGGVHGARPARPGGRRRPGGVGRGPGARAGRPRGDLAPLGRQPVLRRGAGRRRPLGPIADRHARADPRRPARSAVDRRPGGGGCGVRRRRARLPPDRVGRRRAGRAGPVGRTQRVRRQSRPRGRRPGRPHRLRPRPPRRGPLPPLPPGEAARLHAAYGRILSTALGPPATAGAPELAAVAWHLYAAGDAGAGLPAALAAALAAEAAGGYAEAHVQYERALELAGRLPPDALEPAFHRAAERRSGTPVADGGPATPEPAFHRAAERRSVTPVADGGPATPEPAFHRAAERRSGTPVSDAGPEEDGPFDWVALAERAAEAAQLGGDPARAVVLLRMALAAAGPERQPRLRLGLGGALWAAGDSAGALRAYDEALDRLADPDSPEAVRAAAAAAEARMLAGRYRDSRGLAEDALPRARRLGLALEEAGLLGTLGVDLALLGDAEPAVAALDAAVTAAEQAGRPRLLARAMLNRVEVLSGPLNRLSEAAAVAADGLPRLRRLGLGRSYAATHSAALANTLFRLGRWAEADAVIAAALADRPTGAAAVELLLARARLAVGRGDFPAAHADLEQVDRRFTQAVAPRYRAPLLTLSAGLALWEGRTGDAREAVAQALDLVAGSDDVWLVAPVLWHGLRAEGDRAERA